jgi:hypothetical protein
MTPPAAATRPRAAARTPLRPLLLSARHSQHARLAPPPSPRDVLAREPRGRPRADALSAPRATLVHCCTSWRSPLSGLARGCAPGHPASLLQPPRAPRARPAPRNVRVVARTRGPRTVPSVSPRAEPPKPAAECECWTSALELPVVVADLSLLPSWRAGVRVATGAVGCGRSNGTPRRPPVDDVPCARRRSLTKVMP